MLIGIAAAVEPPILSLTWTLSVKAPEAVGIPARIVRMQTSILGIFATLWHRSPHTSRGTTGKTQNFCT